VFDLFLQIFDDGRLTGTHGRTADFSQAIVILTSNLVPMMVPPSRELGFTAEEPAPAAPVMDVRAALTSFLRPELVNRIDEIVLFQPLQPAELRKIVDRYVQEIEALLAPRKTKLALADGVYDFLLEHGSSQRFGARELRRVVDRHLRQPLAREVLSRADGAATIRVEVKDGALAFG
jgi:ATP-dependent Clp protease ATP-binding subunit ClpA